MTNVSEIGKTTKAIIYMNMVILMLHEAIAPQQIIPEALACKATSYTTTTDMVVTSLLSIDIDNVFLSMLYQWMDILLSHSQCLPMWLQLGRRPFLQQNRIRALHVGVMARIQGSPR